MQRLKLFLLLLVFSLAAMIFSGCATLGRDSYPASGSYEEAEAPSPSYAPRPEAMAMEKRTADVRQAPLSQSQEQSAGNDSSDRKRIYTGSASLAVDSPDETKKMITEIAAREGGYVESIKDFLIVIRVPAAKFNTLFQEVLKLGEVKRSSIETLDITERYTDTEARLELARKTRERLYLLLEKTEDLGERLAILREIRRLTEEIEKLSLTMESLEKQIAFSRIQIELIPRITEEVSAREEIPFPWIARLNPLDATIRELKGEVKLELSESFAVFTWEPYLFAETPEGVRLRIGSLKNYPKGDADFWRKAVVFHLSPLYRSAEVIDLPDSKEVLLCTLFSSKDSKPYYYLIGTVVKGEILYVLEVLFLEEEQKEDYLPSILQSLKDMEIKG